MNDKTKWIFILFIFIVLCMIPIFGDGDLSYYFYTNFIYKFIDPNEIEELLDQNNKSKDVILVARKTCSSCISLFPQIRKEIKEIPNVNKVYYYNTDKHRRNPLFENIADSLNLSTVPTVIIIENGKILN